MTILPFLNLGGTLAGPMRAPDAIALAHQGSGGDEQTGIERSIARNQWRVEMLGGVYGILQFRRIRLDDRGAGVHIHFRPYGAQFESDIDPANLGRLEQNL